MSDITFDSMLKVAELSWLSRPVTRVEVNKKTFKTLRKMFNGTNKKVGSLYGIDIYTKPRIRKMRIYYA